MEENNQEKPVSIKKIINSSDYISRDLSWLYFNYRVFDQCKYENRSIIDRLKFLAITASNLDEFMMIRIGSLYNYLDYDKHRIDYCGLREWPFKEKLFTELQKFTNEQSAYFNSVLKPAFEKNGFDIVNAAELSLSEQRKVNYYFSKIVFPMLTPMVVDNFRPFPVLNNKRLSIGVTTKTNDKKEPLKTSFVQIPQNLPRFFEIERGSQIVFVPIESIIKFNIGKLFKNVPIVDTTIFRITRNGDFDYDDYDESEVDFVEEIQKKLKKRKTGRVVRIEIESGFSKKLLKLFKKKFDIDDDNIFVNDTIIDYTAFWSLVGHNHFASITSKPKPPVMPLFGDKSMYGNVLDYVKKQDIFLHHPYNNMDIVIKMLEEAAVDPNVLAIKITIYRLAKDSAITEALLRAAEHGVHVSVLFEVKARFDEENNIQEGQRLEKAGCSVIYGIDRVKTHTKLLMIVRKQKNDVVRYVHMSSGNYNEATAKIYSDTSLITTKRVYGNDVSEFFNVITGHSEPSSYKKLITAPGDLRKKLISLIRTEARNAKKGLASGIILKVNSLEDRFIIDELYKASQLGVKIKLIVRGICCIRPGRKGLSDNITVKSIVGEFLEHARFYYFHNTGDFKVYGGSADIMVRSFDKRIESIFLLEGISRSCAAKILEYNLKDSVNSYNLKEDGSFTREAAYDSDGFNLHKESYYMAEDDLENTILDKFLK